MKWKAASLVLAILLSLVITFGAVANDTITIVSGTGVGIMAYGPITTQPSGIDDPNWGTPFDVELAWTHPVWQDPTDPAFGFEGASWISTSYETEEPFTIDTWRKFETTVNLCAGAQNISGTIRVTGDNADQAFVNGSMVGSSESWYDVAEYTFTLPAADQVSIGFILKNWGGRNSPFTNPTGIIFSATIDYDCPTNVVIEIKPVKVSDCYNKYRSGIIPVKIFGSDEFDVSQIDLYSLELEGLPIVIGYKSHEPLSYSKDFNQDGFMDVLVKFKDTNRNVTEGCTPATLTGQLLDGTPFSSTGEICFVDGTNSRDAISD